MSKGRMRFVWDDEKYMLIHELRKYDENRFVNVRKLFVTPNTSSNEVSDFLHF